VISLVVWMADLNCFSGNDTLFSLSVRGTTYIGNCWQIVDLKAPEINRFIVSPNTTGDFIGISSRSVTYAELVFVIGRKIFETTHQSINLAIFENGINFLRVYAADCTL
jgi:hypothetical protein